MTGYLLDRDVLGAAEDPRGNRNAHAWMAGIPDDDLYILVITVMEATKGFSRQKSQARTASMTQEVLGHEADFKAILSAFGDRVLMLDCDVAERWGQLLAAREANVMDAAIAATAAAHDLVVATRNVRHFRGRGVRVIDPFRTNPSIIPP